MDHTLFNRLHGRRSADLSMERPKSDIGVFNAVACNSFEPLDDLGLLEAGRRRILDKTHAHAVDTVALVGGGHFLALKDLETKSVDEDKICW